MDYAIAQHAEGNWLSNFEEPSPVGPLLVRQMAWWRAPVVPASSLDIGNQRMDDPGFEFSLKEPCPSYLEIQGHWTVKRER